MITLSAVHKTFGPNAVLRGVDLTIDRGTSMVVIGGSGTGKSVLLKSILGLVRPDAGLIALDGQDVRKAEREAFLARFGMLFQGGALFDSLKVWENVAFRLMRGPLARPRRSSIRLINSNPSRESVSASAMVPRRAVAGPAGPKAGVKPQAARASGRARRARRLSHDIDDPPWHNDDFLYRRTIQKLDHGRIG